MKKDLVLKKDRVALIVVDMQKFFCDKKSDACVPNADIIIYKVKKLIDAFYTNDRPIILTRHVDLDDKDSLMFRWWAAPILEDDPMSEIIADLDTERGTSIIKRQYDAFFETELKNILTKNDIQQVVICGVLTNICCETTARSAFMRGYEVYFTTDSTATYKKEMHDATLLNLSYGFAVLMTTDEVLKIMQ